MDGIAQCRDALGNIRRAKFEMLPVVKYEEGEVDFAYQTARNALILAEAHIKTCLEDWGALQEPPEASDDEAQDWTSTAQNGEEPVDLEPSEKAI